MRELPLKRGLLTAAGIVVADQVSKWLILERFLADPTPVEVLPFFNLVLTWNRGVSFGAFNDGGAYNAWIFTGVAAVIVVFLLGWLRKADTPLVIAALGGIIGGAVGNVIDRLRLDAVVDFLDLHAAGYHWPAFNVADSAIVVGAIVLVADALFRRGKLE
ncbi:MAG: signal peptidase II [Alphaproteobacteria bacterium RIFOXYD12_FULL_60_8]|nr:MAG: signal peptidase II [Alphaproteobacteria bacterium RIFOXYD12_FULL_60_8]